MKKLVFFAIFVIAFGTLTVSAQVKSTTLISVKGTSDGGIVTCLDSTFKATDTFFTMPEIAYTSSLLVFFPAGPITKRVGSGIYKDSIDSSHVTPGAQYWARVKCWKDTVVMYTAVGTFIPFFPKEKPGVKVLNVSETIDGAELNTSLDNGYDTSTVTITQSTDSKYKPEHSYSKSFKIDSVKIIKLSIVGMQSNHIVYYRIVNKNSVGIDSVLGSFVTLPEPQKPWLRKPVDSIIIGETTVDFYGRGIPYGLPTSINVKSGKLVLGSDTLKGAVESRYHIQVTNLKPGTDYWFNLYAKNAKGQDSIILGKITTLAHNTQVFSAATDSLVRQYGSTKVRMYGKLNLVKGTVASAYAGLFTDESCGVGLVPSIEITSSFKEGVNPLYIEFEVDTTDGSDTWGRFWGTDNKGGYDLNPTPQKLRVVNYKPITVSIQEKTEIKISVYPNPATDFIFVKTNSPDIKIVEIYDMSGKNVLSGFSNVQIDVRSLMNGPYILKVGESRTKIIIQK